MKSGGPYAGEWEDLRLVVQEHPEHWQTLVYDLENCEALYTAQRRNIEKAKLAALDFATILNYGPSHDLKLKGLAAMLSWEPYRKSISARAEDEAMPDNDGSTTTAFRGLAVLGCEG